VKVVVFECLKGAIKAIVGMHPGIVGRVGTAVGRNHADARRHFFAVLVTHTQLEAADLPYIMTLRGVDASARTANDFLDPERGIAIFVADVANPAAIWRKACLGPIELTERQRQRRGTLHGREPELLPLAAVITAEQ